MAVVTYERDLDGKLTGYALVSTLERAELDYIMTQWFDRRKGCVMQQTKYDGEKLVMRIDAQDYGYICEHGLVGEGAINVPYE